jgi:acyl-CoA thioester hydrolase
VGYAETDQMGVAHHGAHVVWLERGRVEALRDRGVRYRDLEERGVIMPVHRMEIHYHMPVRFDDLLIIETRLAELTRVRCVFVYRVLEADTERLVAEATTELALCDREGRPHRRGRQILESMLAGP